jgi:hypothetical protein
MQALKAFLRQTEIAYQLADAVASVPLVQAVHAEPLPWLLQDWIAFRAAGIHGQTAASDIDHMLDSPTNPEFDFWRVRDDPVWGLKNGRLPVLIRIHLAPARMRDAPAGAIADARSRVASLVADFRPRLAILIEDRALARATAMPGDEVKGFDRGTMGGVLEDPVDGQQFGMTCAHVAPHGYSVQTGSGMILGLVHAASLLTPSSGRAVCRPHGASANRLDAALFSLPSGPSAAGSGLRQFAGYGSGQRALMAGAKSGGPHSYYLGSLGLTQSIDISVPAGAGHSGSSVKSHCFHDLATIRPVPSPWGFLGRGHRSLSGDSGAFITDVGGTDWFGVLCATDGTEGFFFDATEALGWARNELGRPGLQVA